MTISTIKAMYFAVRAQVGGFRLTKANPAKVAKQTFGLKGSSPLKVMKEMEAKFPYLAR